jgi:tRNA A37 N6-isopentenylltransferase MiaA
MSDDSSGTMLPPAPEPKAKVFSVEKLDKMIEEIDKYVKRQNEWINNNRNKYASSFIASVAGQIKVFEEIRELIRQQRQDKQMTGMSGRIE